jgi:aryl-alcohol dehydrogenase-like predicted oxidoreductase
MAVPAGKLTALVESAAIMAIRRAADQGVTLFDTDHAYRFGASERV